MLSEGNHTRFELLSKTFLTFQCDETYPPASLFMGMQRKV